MSQDKDWVNHPDHYITVDTDGTKHECLVVIESLKLPYHEASAFKYLWRAGRKDQAKRLEDLHKAIFFLQRKVKILENA